MTSEISKASNAGNVVPITRAKRTPRKPPASAPADRVGVSSQAAELARALQHVREAPDVREAKIRSLRSAIASGRYEPDPRVIAEKILEHGL